MTDKNLFAKFTNRYALSKTLRFELKPVGKTLENMREHLRWDKDLQTFLADQDIEDAYQVLKPVFDKLHEEFITKSLENEEAKKISFAEYFDVYKKFRNETDRDEKIKLEKPLSTEEIRLRGIFATIYKVQGEDFKNEVGNDEKGKQLLKEESYKVLTEVGILKYIRARIDDFVAMSLKTRDGEDVTKEKLEKALVKNGEENKGVFEGFFTYLTGFNQNRENYYAIDDKATSVANRIVAENLPKFCDNALDFAKRKDEYENALQFLKGLKATGKDISTQDKDGNELYRIDSELFEIAYFNNCLSQKEIEDYNKKIGNANFVANLYNQQKNGEQGFKKLPKFKELYKQIGCGDKKEFIPAIKNDDELKKVLDDVATKGEKFFDAILNNENGFRNLILKLDNFQGVYWSDKALNTISSKYFKNWDSLKEILKTEKIFKKEKDEIKIPQTIELADLFAVLDTNEVVFKETFKDNNGKKQEILKGNDKNSLKLLRMVFVDIEVNKGVFEQHKEWITSTETRDDGFYKEDANTQKVKTFLDAVLFSNQILKYFKVRENKIKGNSLNAEISESLDKILLEENPTEHYDLVRNYLTKKPTAEVNKLKLNFENGMLLSGWSDGQEKSKASVILKKDGILYLGILEKRNIFDTSKTNNPVYQNITKNCGRLVLRNLAFKTLAGRGFLADNKGEKYGDMGKREPQEAIVALQKLIKDRGYADKYSKLKNIAEKKYTDKKIFDKEVQEALKESYVCEFTGIDWGTVEEYINNGELYLFEIKNKKRNIQNKYWQEVFKEGGLIQLSGKGEIFYRPSLKEKDKEQLKTIDKNGKEIYKNYRFTKEKFLFHCSTKFNYKEKTIDPKYLKAYVNEFNKSLNTEIIKLGIDEDICFIGIDRGEKHLVYYSVVNQKGEIFEQGSFNVIKDETSGKEHDYAKKLEKKAGNRDEARKNWTTIGTIKELKDGYISQVVRKIVDLAVKYNAYIILENLNSGFKRGRQKIEKQVYQKLELALAKKLNFLVDKKAKDGNIGSVQKALQLTPPVANFSDIENAKQWGIMLYIRANYTSQTDPITGWRKTIYFTKTRQEDLKKEICEKFSEIGFDGKDYYFVCKIDEKIIKDWKLWSGKDGKELERFRWNNRTRRIEQQHIIEILEKVFGKQTTETKNLKDKITEYNVKDLKYAIDLIQQIRNTGIDEKDTDFILSPVRDENGNHFDSRESGSLVPNGDANGAYNIARKGIMAFKRIKENPEKPDLYISDVDWDTFVSK